jgi:hypothetical protein
MIFYKILLIDLIVGGIAILIFIGQNNPNPNFETLKSKTRASQNK